MYCKVKTKMSWAQIAAKPAVSLERKNEVPEIQEDKQSILLASIRECNRRRQMLIEDHCGPMIISGDPLEGETLKLQVAQRQQVKEIKKSQEYLDLTSKIEELQRKYDAIA